MEATKKCAGCARELPLSMFSKNRRTSDGLQERCKDCFSAYNRRRYAEKRDEIRGKVRKYKEENPRAVFATRLKTCEKNPSKLRARKVVEAALACGELVRPDVCWGCGCSSDEHRIEAHHHDYSRPMDVIWLCTPCHRRMDMQRRIEEKRREEEGD